MRLLRRLLHRAVQLALEPMWSAVEFWMLRTTRSAHQLEFDIITNGDEAVSHLQEAKLIDALLLIQRVDLGRFRRIKLDLNRLMILPVSAMAGAYRPGSRTCYLSEQFVRERAVSDIAIVLVHHACRSRIDHAGIRLYPDLRNRIKSICAKAEISFVERLPRSEYPDIDSWIASRAKALLQRSSRTR